MLRSYLWVKLRFLKSFHIETEWGGRLESFSKENKSIGVVGNLLVCIYKSLHNRRIKIDGTCILLARYRKPSRLPEWFGLVWFLCLMTY